MINKCLFLSNKRAMAGGKILMDRNYDYCRRFFGSENVYFYDSMDSSGRRAIFSNMIRGQFFELDALKQQEIRDLLESNHINYVFLDNSLLGNISVFLRKIRPEIKVITFFHNVEYAYFKAIFSVAKFWHLLSIYTCFKVERSAVRNADVIITLNERDSIALKDIYGRSATFKLPMTLKDSYRGKEDKTPVDPSALELLFVGSRFFANEEAVTWFITNVLPKLTVRYTFTIVGKGFESYTVDNAEHIKVVGFAEDLALYYEKADFVISPIFSGSGMKTKTAEALMYGKNILGTSEAFEGYDVDFDLVGAKLETAGAYIEYLNKVRDKTRFNTYSRNVFLAKYESENQYSNFYNNIKKCLIKND